MPLNLASPGIVIREVDLTLGRVSPASDKIGAIVAPFPKGIVGEPILIQNEQELIENFGTPSLADKQYETWLVASSFLSYGGSLRVIRSDDENISNAFVGSATSIKIKSYEDYINLGYDENVISGVTVCAKDPGSWANGVKVAIIDAKADQILSGLSTDIQVGCGVTQAITSVLAGSGSTSVLGGYLKGVVTGIGVSSIQVKVLSHVSADGTETTVDYQPQGVYSFASGGTLGIHTSGVLTAYTTKTYAAQQDWFDQQTISLTNSKVYWNTLADRPSTSNFAAARGARFDEVHVVVFDDIGSISGNTGTILEKHLSLSKASDAEFSVGSTSYWRKYIAENSRYIFAGSAPSGIVTTAYTSGFTLATDTGWDQSASGIYFAGTGSNVLTLANGKNYDGNTDLTVEGSLSSTLANLSSGYEIFSNSNEYLVDFLLMGSAGYEKETAQALASKLISVAEERKDCIAFISPYRSALLTESSGNKYVLKDSATITDNLISFYSSIPSSSFAVFDSGYKYMYDRFSDTFRYVPLNGDIAGVCARTDTTSFPWFSPAGTSRGAILNAVKLAYNPSKIQRDRLYSNRINPIIFSPGSGIVLFGDKTGLAKSSAFDRINVRRLFIYLEKAISSAAKDQLFEFNDENTRRNFVSTVEPFLRDIQSKRGIEGYRVICDTTNNTASVIDSNEFIADIFIKPNRSINYIGLTFVATRTGVSFEEIVGTV
jgi:hypothetical protein